MFIRWLSFAFYQDFDEFSSCEFTTSGKSELQSYLEEPKLPRIDDFDVLEYWKPLQGRYPILSQMARDILSIPISTVASESVFSIGGRVIDAYRSSLKAETVESLVCVRDWVFNEGKHLILNFLHSLNILNFNISFTFLYM